MLLKLQPARPIGLCFWVRFRCSVYYGYSCFVLFYCGCDSRRLINMHIMTLTSRVTVAVKHPQLQEEGWKRIALPMRGADSASMSATDRGRTLGPWLYGVLVCSDAFTSSTQAATRASFSSLVVDHVQYTIPCIRGTEHASNRCQFRICPNSPVLWLKIKKFNLEIITTDDVMFVVGGPIAEWSHYVGPAFHAVECDCVIHIFPQAEDKCTKTSDLDFDLMTEFSSSFHLLTTGQSIKIHKAVFFQTCWPIQENTHTGKTSFYPPWR